MYCYHAIHVSHIDRQYHHGDREEAYTFTTIEQLLIDFEQDVNEWRNP